jgi:hypothetical protein
MVVQPFLLNRLYQANKFLRIVATVYYKHSKPNSVFIMIATTSCLRDGCYACYQSFLLAVRYNKKAIVKKNSTPSI